MRLDIGPYKLRRNIFSFLYFFPSFFLWAFFSVLPRSSATFDGRFVFMATAKCCSSEEQYLLHCIWLLAANRLKSTLTADCTTCSFIGQLIYTLAKWSKKEEEIGSKRINKGKKQDIRRNVNDAIYIRYLFNVSIYFHLRPWCIGSLTITTKFISHHLIVDKVHSFG